MSESQKQGPEQLVQAAKEYIILHSRDKFSLQAVAEALFVSVTTVRYHVGNLMSKTGFSSRTELAVKAVRSGITIPGFH